MPAEQRRHASRLASKFLQLLWVLKLVEQVDVAEDSARDLKTLRQRDDGVLDEIEQLELEVRAACDP